MKFDLPRSIPDDVRDLESLLREGGPFSEYWPDYEPREEQILMLREVARAFKSGDVAIIEAGTGTGKTLAYLLSAIISGKKTVITTGLKNLQEQIQNKELKAIRDSCNTNFKSVVLKGRDNYLCIRNFITMKKRFERAIFNSDVIAMNHGGALAAPDDSGYDSPKLNRYFGEGLLFGAPDAESYEKFKHIEIWREKTKTGEFSELQGGYEKQAPFNFLRSTSDDCQGKRCPHFVDCFINKVRREAAEADIILLNHNLFLLDAIFREFGFNIIPEWEAAIIDEAHLFESTAVKYFSRRCSTKDLLDNAKEFYDYLNRFQQNFKERINEKWEELLLKIHKLSESIKDQCYLILSKFQDLRGERKLWPKEPQELWDPISLDCKNFLMKLPPLLDHASQSAAAFAQEDDEMKPLAREFKTFMENLEFILDNSDPTYAYQLKTTEEDVVFEAIPIEVAGFLSDALFKKEKTIVLTSATMAVNKSLDYFKRRLGVSVYAEPLIFQSPFDYKSNTILYLPTHLPFPNVLGENFDELAVAELENILNVTRGRALILFTSFHQMNEFYNALAPKVKYKIYKQGMTYSRSQLLERFIKEESSVLMAVKSFWQGIDVPGPSLSAVIIVKLPFPVKTHPMTEAKEDYIRARNGDPFYDFYIPEATILLKQAIGRLLRNKNDKGLIAILDSRISFKPYGPKILSNLPPSPRCFKLEAVKDFFTKNGV